MSEYVPGALYRATYNGERRNVAYCPEGLSDPVPWFLFRTSDEWVRTDDLTDISGPLVVLDPDDEADCDRLWTAVWGADRVLTRDHVAERLRTLTGPPKPAEPQGLGAVMESAAGTRWVRSARRDAPWTDGIRYRAWDDISVVRVLSEGVQ